MFSIKHIRVIVKEFREEELKTEVKPLVQHGTLKKLIKCFCDAEKNKLSW